MRTPGAFGSYNPTTGELLIRDIGGHHNCDIYHQTLAHESIHALQVCWHPRLPEGLTFTHIPRAKVFDREGFGKYMMPSTCKECLCAEIQAHAWHGQFLPDLVPSDDFILNVRASCSVRCYFEEVRDDPINDWIQELYSECSKLLVERYSPVTF